MPSPARLATDRGHHGAPRLRRAPVRL